MSEDVYKKQLIDRFQNLKYRKALEKVSVDASASNPLCGDMIRFQLSIGEHHKITAAGWSGDGCAICLVAADLLAEDLEGKTISEAQEFSEIDMIDMLGIDIKPSRIQCATLGLHAVQKGVARIT